MTTTREQLRDALQHQTEEQLKRLLMAIMDLIRNTSK